MVKMEKPSPPQGRPALPSEGFVSPFLIGRFSNSVAAALKSGILPGKSTELTPYEYV